MARALTKMVYSFDELDSSAKETARDWWRGCIDTHDYEPVIEDAVEIAELMGIEIDPQYYKGKPCGHAIWWSGFSSQGDGACFEGTYRYRKGCVKLVMDYAPKDGELHRIVKGLYEIQQKNFYQLVVKVKQSGHYYHKYCTTVDVERYDDKDMTDDAEETVTELLRDFMEWIYDRLEEQNDYLYSDEHVDEAILCKGYEFYENGEIV